MDNSIQERILRVGGERHTDLALFLILHLKRQGKSFVAREMIEALDRLEENGKVIRIRYALPERKDSPSLGEHVGSREGEFILPGGTTFIKVTHD